jgi:Phasin protein
MLNQQITHHVYQIIAKEWQAMAETSKLGDFSAFGKAQTEGMLNLQRQLLETYEQAGRAWLGRMQSEVELWSRLGTKLAATHSVPEAVQAYQKCLAEQMQMSAADGKQLYDDCQRITQKIAGSSNGWWPTAIT